MSLSIPVSVYYADNNLKFLIISATLSVLTGLITWFFTRKSDKDIGKKEGYLIVSFGWIIFSLFGALPFYISGAIPSFTDAFFETISGFTTTGASILNDIEAMPHSLLFWRSMTQWLGGMGIIVLSLAILPILGIGGMQMFVAEVPGLKPDKLHPRIKGTAKRLWAIYILFTLIEIVLLMIGDMSLFDAINHSFTTMATGGYSTKQASIAHWDSPYIQYVITLFMFIAGTNFTLSYFALHIRFKKVWQNEEFRFYTGFILGFTIIIAYLLYVFESTGFEQSFRDSLFQVVSIMTTTGFATVDYYQWHHFTWVLLFVLMFFGGSAGSTGGSIKIVRILLVLKNGYMELKRLVHPNAIIPVRFNHQAVPPNIIANVLAFIMFYIVIFVIGTIIMTITGLDFESAMGSVAATLGNIGPGIGEVGPAENFYNITDFGKWFLSFLMLLGRLELFTVLVILSPVFWKK